jgi:plasmid stabilization system protein ParE
VAVFWKQKAESDRENFYENMEDHSKKRANEIDLAIAKTVAMLGSHSLPGMRVEGSDRIFRFVMSTGHYILYEDDGVDITILRVMR